VPERGFVVEFTVANVMHLRFVTERGRVVEFAVQYEANVDGVWYRVMRYDSAHGYPHRDVLDPQGNTVQKEPVNLSYAEAFTFAYDDIEANWPRYREEFLRRMRS